MVHASNAGFPFQTTISNGAQTIVADVAADKGGAGCGFRPHELVEAGLAACINITVRMFAAHHGIPLRTVNVNVDLDRSRAEEAVFRYTLVLDGDLTPDQIGRLEAAAQSCPVSKTLALRCSSENRTLAMAGKHRS